MPDTNTKEVRHASYTRQDCLLVFHIVKSVAYVALNFYVTGSWHGDLRRYKHKNLLAIFLFTCKVASRSPEVTSRTFANLSFAQSVIKQGCGTGRYIELHVWSSHQHERAQRLYVCAFVHR